MGGGSNKQPQTKMTPAPVQPPVPTQTFQGFFPAAQQGLLADQLAMGGFGDAATNLGILSNLYKDVTMPVISRPDQIAPYLKQANIPGAAAASTANTANDLMSAPWTVGPGNTRPDARRPRKTGWE